MRAYKVMTINFNWAGIFFLVLLFILSDVQAQSFQVNLSSKHVEKINRSKTGATKLKLYKKYYSKDSTRQMRKLKRDFRRDLNKLARYNKVQERKERLSEKLSLPTPIDSLAVLEQYGSLLHDSGAE